MSILALVLMVGLCIPVMGADGEQIIRNPFDNPIFKVLDNITEKDVNTQYGILFGYKPGENNFVELNEFEGFQINFKSYNEPTSSEYFMQGYNGSDLFPNIHIVINGENAYMAHWIDTQPMYIRSIYRITFNDLTVEDLPPYEPVVPTEPTEPKIKVKLNGTEIEFDQPPVMVNNRTFVPVRAIFEAIGATVEWNGDTQTVTAIKEDTTIQLKIDSRTMYLNYRGIDLDEPPQIINGRTLVPLRVIVESFNINVEWQGETYTVILTSQ